MTLMTMGMQLPFDQLYMASDARKAGKKSGDAFVKMKDPRVAKRKAKVRHAAPARKARYVHAVAWC